MSSSPPPARPMVIDALPVAGWKAIATATAALGDGSWFSKPVAYATARVNAFRALLPPALNSARARLALAPGGAASPAGGVLDAQIRQLVDLGALLGEVLSCLGRNEASVALELVISSIPQGARYPLNLV